MYDSVFQAGVAGMQQSHSRLQQIQHDVSRLNAHSSPQPRTSLADAVAVPAAGAAVKDLPPSLSVPQSSQAPASAGRKPQDLTGLLVEQKKEQLLFTASARVVSTASQTLGRVLNEWG